MTSADKIAKELEVDAEKARAIKQRFENGEIYNDENRPPRNRDLDDRALFDDGRGQREWAMLLTHVRMFEAVWMSVVTSRKNY